MSSVANKLLLASAKKGGGAANVIINARWDMLNPLYCANQSAIYANSAASTYLYPTAYGAAFYQPFCITANSFQSTQYFVTSAQYANGAANSTAVGNNYVVVFSADFTTNTVALVNTAIINSTATIPPADYYTTSILLNDNLMVMYRVNANTTGSGNVQMQAMIVNTASKTITFGTLGSVSVGNLVASFAAQINSTAVILGHTQANAAASVANTVYSARVVTVNPTNGAITFGSATVFNNRYAVIPTGTQDIGFIVQNATSVCATSVGNAASVGAYYMLGISGTTVTAGANGALATNNLYQATRPVLLISNTASIYVDTKTSNPVVWSFNPTTNVCTYVNVSSNLSSLLIGAQFSNKAEQILNNNTNVVLGTAVRNTDPASNVGYSNNFLLASAVTYSYASNNLIQANSNFPIPELIGKAVTGASYYYPGADAGGGAIFTRSGTVQGIYIAVGAPLSISSAVNNTFEIAYRFLSANTSSLTNTYSGPGSYTYTAARAGQLFLQVYGPGGYGNAASNVSGNSTHPGGGGGFAYKTITVTNGQTVPLVVGRAQQNSTVLATNSSANTIVCQPGGNGNTTANGTGGVASGGDLNANGSAGIGGTVGAVLKTTGDLGQGGFCGAPGPARAGFGFSSTLQVYGAVGTNTNVSNSSWPVGTGGLYTVANAAGVPGANGAIIVGLK